MSSGPSTVPTVTRLEEDHESNSLLPTSTDAPFPSLRTPEPLPIQHYTVYHPMVPHLELPQEHSGRKPVRPLHPTKPTIGQPGHSRKGTSHSVKASFAHSRSPSYSHSHSHSHHPSISLQSHTSFGADSDPSDSDDGTAGPDSPPRVPGAGPQRTVPVASMAPNGSIHRFKPGSVIAQELDDAARSRFIDELETLFQDSLKEKAILQQEIDQNKSKQNDLQSDMEDLEGEILKTDDPTKRNGYERMLEGKLNELEYVVGEQEFLLRKWKDSVLECDSMQMEIAQIQEMKRGIIERKERGAELDDWISSHALAQHQKRIRKRKEMTQQRMKREEEARIAMEAEREKRRLANEAAYSYAMKRLGTVIKENQERKRDLDRFMEEQRIAQAKNLLALKQRVNGVMEELRKDREKLEKRRRDKEERRMKERVELEGAGRNADQIFRQRDLEEKLNRFDARRRVKQDQDAKRIAEEIAREEVRRREKLKEEQLKQFAEEEDLKKRGRNVIDMERFKARQKKEKLRSIVEEMEKRKEERRKREEERAANPLLYDALHGPQDEALRAAEMASDEEHDEIRDSAPEDSPDEEAKEEAKRGQNSLGISQLRVDPALGDGDEALDDQALPPIVKTNVYIQRAQKAKLAVGLEKRRKALQDGVPKVVCGKSYSKTSQFLAEPSSLRFVDFEVGKSYEQTLIITNVSFSFNHFKLLPLEDQWTDFFEIAYIPVGRMSAGSTASLKVKFTPKQNKDISAVIPFLAETGPFGVPVYCCTKKVNISIDCEEIDMGTVILGEESRQEIIVRNDGALGVEWRLERIIEELDSVQQSQQEESKDKSDIIAPSSSVVTPIDFSQSLKTIRLDVDIPIITADPDAAESDTNNPRVPMISGYNYENREESLDPLSQIDIPTTGFISGYSEIRIPIVFRPRIDAPFQLPFQLHFGPKPEQKKLKRYRDLQWNSPSEFPIFIHGSGSKVPIYLANDTLNFQVCASEKLYRSHFVVCNRGKNAHQIQFHCPVEWRQWVEFVPSMAYVQAHESMKIQVKFHPNEELERKLEDETKRFNESGQLNANANQEVNENSDSDRPMDMPAFLARAFSFSGEIRVLDQNLPVLFHIHGELSTFALVPSTVQLDFGRSYTHQTRLLSVRLHNPSPFLQQLHFPHLNSLLQISPDDGFLTIPPGRTISFVVHFTPKAAIHHEFHFKLVTKMRQTIQFLVTAQVQEAPLSFSHSLIRFSPTPNGEIDRTEVFITNNSKSNEKLIEFAFPSNLPSPFSPDLSNALIAQQFDSFLTVTPSAARLKPGETKRFEIEFAPQYKAPPEIEELDEDESDAEAKEEEKKDIADLGSSGAKTPKSGAQTPSKSKLSKKQLEAEKLKLEEEERKRREALEEEKRRKDEEKRAKQAEIDAIRGVEKQREREKESELSEPRNEELMPQWIQFAHLESGDDSEPWSRHGRHRLAVMCRDVNRAQSADSAESVSASAAARAPLDALYMTVETTLIEPKIQFFPSEIDFGLLAAEATQTKTVELKNFTDFPLQISCNDFSALEPFQLLTPLSDYLMPNSSMYLTIQYAPRRERRSETRAFFRGTGSAVAGALASLTMRGQCVKPRITVDPPYGSLHMGNILAGEIAKKTLTITNQHAEFPFQFDFQSAAPPASDAQDPLASLTDSERNLRGGSEFSFFPAFGSIGPGESKQITVVFQPDHASESEFKTQIAIGAQRFTVAGKAHERPLFVLGGERSHAVQVADESVSGSALVPANPTLGLTSLADGALKYQNPLAFLDSDPTLPYSSLGSLYPALFQPPKPLSAGAPPKAAAAPAAASGSSASQKRRSLEAGDFSVPPLQLSLSFNPLSFVEAPQKAGPAHTLWTAPVTVKCCNAGDGKENPKDKGEGQSSFEASILPAAAQSSSTASVASALGTASVGAAPATGPSSKRPQPPNATQTAAQTGTLAAVDSLWSIQPVNGSLKPGDEVTVTFQFDYTEYLRLRALDVEAELIGVAGLLERNARIALKNAVGGNQLVEVKLRVQAH